MQDRSIDNSVTHPHRIKIDPGSKTTGIAVVQEHTGQVTSALEINHRGQNIKNSLESRRALRRGRRSRKTRYRKPRFLNRKRPEGWLPPSLMSRVLNIETWTRRLIKLCPVTAISQELVRFDTQKMPNPEVSGVEYQHGELFGFEVKEYLLSKWGHNCVYCGSENVPLEVEHITPKSIGGSNRVSNLTLACRHCNQKKGSDPIDKFLRKKPELLKKVLALAKSPLKDAAAVNSTRWELWRRLKLTGLPVETGSGGLTKFNRKTREIEKTHWIDAACVGKSTPQRLLINGVKPLIVTAKGHGVRQRCRPNKYGFPKAHAPSAKFFKGFQTGDIVIADIKKGKYAGQYTGRIAIRYRPSFVLSAKPFAFAQRRLRRKRGLRPPLREQESGIKIDVHPKYLKTIFKADGYEYLSNQ
ncbi:MAG: HNH endonuclease [Moorea sp. SIO3F7]|nr:HNH endonuclease [Moorena sp. SIO3F7]